jgi:hypothetical protein
MKLERLNCKTWNAQSLKHFMAWHIGFGKRQAISKIWRIPGFRILGIDVIKMYKYLIFQETYKLAGNFVPPSLYQSRHGRPEDDLSQTNALDFYSKGFQILIVGNISINTFPYHPLGFCAIFLPPLLILQFNGFGLLFLGRMCQWTSYLAQPYPA